MRRRWGWAVTIALAAGGLGCGHSAAGTASRPSGGEQAKADFVSAYDAVKSGARPNADAGHYQLTGIGHGAVEVSDRSKAVGARSVDDGWITDKVKSELATTREVTSGDIHVDTSGGIVLLSGNVDNGFVAKRAIRTALGVPGVHAVDSELRFSSARPAPQFTKETRQ